MTIEKAQNIMQNETLKNNFNLISFYCAYYNNYKIRNKKYYANYRISNRKLKLKKNPGYIDFKTINEIIISRHPSKYFEIIAFRYYAQYNYNLYLICIHYY
ncbi:Uncharacterized protein FWK35_00016508 [Aphis craccivora]|uniref:Uncharacterized protein n=1 Tax=Aphis craccivora TaxID=307492 RepID=A0A6G0Z5L9_APHCR|nr:Uncharacterized protein FWK35_00016508 [Aphis craccivora]